MAVAYSALLAVSAFWLGACPFSVWVGRWLLGKEIRDYGDGNPGATNVFRAGSRKAGCLAAFLDAIKGIPFVLMAHSTFGLPEPMVMMVGLSAILGNAFSPILRLRGGKSIGVTFGVLFALPQHEMVIVLAAFLLLCFLIIEIDAWIVILGTAGSVAYIAVTGGNPWQSLFMFSVLTVLTIKHFGDLQVIPRFKIRPLSWVQSRRRET